MNRSRHIFLQFRADISQIENLHDVLSRLPIFTSHLAVFSPLQIWVVGTVYAVALFTDTSVLIPAVDEECVQQGIEFAPARLRQKRPRDAGEDANRGRASKHGNSLWDPSSSDMDHSDSEDSMSDLYPCQYT